MTSFKKETTGANVITDTEELVEHFYKLNRGNVSEEFLRWALKKDAEKSEGSKKIYVVRGF